MGRFKVTVWAVLAALLLSSCADWGYDPGPNRRGGGTSDEDRDRTRDQNR
jgi:hypothetical protein